MFGRTQIPPFKHRGLHTAVCEGKINILICYQSDFFYITYSFATAHVIRINISSNIVINFTQSLLVSCAGAFIHCHHGVSISVMF